MKKTLTNTLLTSVILIFVSCSHKCIEAIKYQTNTVNVKAITGKVGKQANVDIGVGEISIDPKYREASDRLKELDRIQSEICNQLKSMKKGSEKDRLQKKYIEALIEMLQIAKNPESVSSNLLQKKETAKKSANSLLKKLNDLLTDEKESGSNNSQQVIELLTELNRHYLEIITLNQQLNTTDNAKWNEIIKKNNEEIERRKIK